MTRDQTATQKPRRACVGCKEALPISQLVRFVRAPDDRLTFDLAARLPGRGAWTCPRWDCFRQGLRVRGFGRALHARVSESPEQLVQAVHQGLCQRLLSQLGLAYRCRQCVFGQARCQQAVQKDHAQAVLVACDVSQRSDRNSAVELEGGKQIRCALTKRQLGQAFGRQEVGFVAVLWGHVAQRLLWNVHRLERLTMSMPPVAC